MNSFQGNTKLFAKYMNAIFGDQFYWPYILWIRKFSRDFYFAIFSFSNYSRVLKFASKHSCSRPFLGLKIGTLCISCERQINVMHRIVVHVVRQLKLELYSSFCLHKETITQFVTHTDSNWTTSESIIRYSTLTFN